MKFSMRFGLGSLAVAFVAVSMISSASARPQYFKAFPKKYPKLTSQVKKVKCNTCHFGKAKKNRNDYGKAVMKHVGKKNQKNPKAILAAFEKAAKEKKPGTDKTFGDLIKAGKLPGTAPE